VLREIVRRHPVGVNAAGRAGDAAHRGKRQNLPLYWGDVDPRLRFLAYDTIMVFPDQFRKHILPERIHLLNVSFMVPTCAGSSAAPAATSPTTSSCWARSRASWPPSARLRALCAAAGEPRARATHVRVLDGPFTAQAFITTDIDDNQITAFHPGAMSESHRNRIADANA
jgi:adenosine kinase